MSASFSFDFLQLAKVYHINRGILPNRIGARERLETVMRRMAPLPDRNLLYFSRILWRAQVPEGLDPCLPADVLKSIKKLFALWNLFPSAFFTQGRRGGYGKDYSSSAGAEKVTNFRRRARK